MELQKCKKNSEEGPPHPPFLRKLSMTVEINQKKLYYNYYTKVKISGKILCQPPVPPPQLQMLCYVPEGQCNRHTTLNLAVVRVYKKENPQPLC
jgi:hypothetical protein